MNETEEETFELAEDDLTLERRVRKEKEARERLKYADM